MLLGLIVGALVAAALIWLGWTALSPKNSEARQARFIAEGRAAQGYAVMVIEPEQEPGQRESISYVGLFENRAAAYQWSADRWDEDVDHEVVLIRNPDAA